MLTRRFLLASALAGLSTSKRVEAFESDALRRKLASIEAASGGRLGVAVRDTGTGTQVSHRADERFPLCSTFKLLAAAAVLARIDAGRETLDRFVAFDEHDLVANSPVTGAHVAEGSLPLAALCEAAITRSDNAAGNLLLRAIGGPEGLTAYARSLGDTVTRLDRFETALNEALPGDPRDTTSPAAMLDDLDRLLLGNALSGASRTQLNAWLAANRTGDKRLRAGLPSGWRVGDKTGSGDRGTTNHVAILHPPGAKPILVTVYLTETDASADACNAAIAEIGRAIAA